jgi:transposase InsO family protein
LLGVPPRTLRDWRRRVDAPPASRGRPCKSCPPELRAEVRRFLREVSGPAVGLEAMRALFPEAPRCVLADLLRRYRRVWRRRNRQRGRRLVWKRPGAVWAIDFSEAPWLIDGVFPYLFAVRDLASHCQLAWRPVMAETAEEAVAALEALFREHGPPLVIKCDNGSAFLAAAFQSLLARHGVLPLYSPPCHPQYNGALERSNGTLKTYTDRRAIAEQHPFRWTSENVESARQLANRLSRPWGHRGQTPEQAWQARLPIPAAERRRFQAEADHQRPPTRADLGLPAASKLSHADQARLDRLALERSLLVLDYLEMKCADRPAKARRPARAALERTACASATATAPSEENLDQALAAALAADTMRTSAGVAASVISPASAPPPAHVEPAHPSWFTRSIPPLISHVKTAIFSW